MPNILRAANGQQNESDSFAGPSSYPTGGFSHRTDLGRVDNASVELDRGDFEAHVESIDDDNNLVIQAFSQGGGEAAAGTDLSSDTFTTDSYRV